MKCKLFIDSDTCLEFSSRAKAFIYTERQGIFNYCLLATYEETLRVSVWNSYLTNHPIEYFDNESNALKYIGSFL